MYFTPVWKVLMAMANTVTGDIRMPRDVFVLFCTLGQKKTDRNFNSPDMWALGESKLVMLALALLPKAAQGLPRDSWPTSSLFPSPHTVP